MKSSRPLLASVIALAIAGCSDDTTDASTTGGGAGGKGSSSSSSASSTATSSVSSTSGSPTTSSTSSAPKPNGQACGGATECSSGFCVDGVCCDTACADKCNACVAASTGGVDGTCAPVSDGLDPDDDCGADTCNGSGACACGDLKKSGEETDVDCGGPGCGKCVEGRDCEVPSDCGTGFCPATDKVCCANACAGVCVSCAAAKTGFADGQCAAITLGTDPENECADPGFCAAANQCTVVLDPSNGAADNVCIHYIVTNGFDDIIVKSDDHTCLAKPLEDIPVSTGWRLYVWSKDAGTSNRVRINLAGLTPPNVETKCSAHTMPPNKAEMDAEIVASGFLPTSWQTDAQVGHILTNAGCANGAAFRIQF